ncbi:hypothetical protein ACTXT7_009271 [Hymenolepis weldensis]
MKNTAGSLSYEKPMSWTLTTTPRIKLDVDFAGPIEGDLWTCTQATQVPSNTGAKINALNHIFTTHGFPETLIRSQKKTADKEILITSSRPHITQNQMPSRAVCQRLQKGPAETEEEGMTEETAETVAKRWTTVIYKIQVNYAIWIRYRNRLRPSSAGTGFTPTSTPPYLLLDTFKLPTSKSGKARERNPEKQIPFSKRTRPKLSRLKMN